MLEPLKVKSTLAFCKGGTGTKSYKIIYNYYKAV